MSRLKILEIKLKGRTGVCNRILGGGVVSGEKPIELTNSWNFAKYTLV